MLPPSPHERQEPPAHTHGSSRASRGAALLPPARSAVASSCLGGKPLLPASDPLFDQEQHRSSRLLPVYSRRRRPRDAGRAVVPRHLTTDNSTRWYYVASVAVLAHPVPRSSTQPTVGLIERGGPVEVAV